ncbi:MULTISPECIES: 4-hydroxythreonine-4-phosphate dehydrogenase PdxA [unclassified Actinobaculum]|uniref:4-hydroxythreonine-4-phosphate dehydrogenase PdxA n=1 Tax=unclassified Actinobaculum TaxID=2609299 RepID=UPI000D526CF3|nr:MULTISPECIES: 4-hydroxythreonine-4-phosphate dehydrogenase PdxA [unclassified Actinobaculum]AWE43007.1 4-hydroxythreonine-4-phosphate dehydrogenase PdxA [Actinobaculum sp. 313]RTE48609.1 4-hydroxythreonine-4-phosphate dehydrogenase PdxA [Actinobaculum sp. 352]
MTRPVLAMTIGDPVGIGPEIAVKTLLEFASDSRTHGIAVGDAAAVRRAISALGVDAEVRVLSHWDADPAGEGVVDVFDTGVLGDDLPEWGKVDARAGRAAVVAIETATTAALEGKVAGIVTGPINKEAIWASGSEFLGHTEMLGHLTGVSQQDTMFVCRNRENPAHSLRIFFATRHLSLRKALDAITIDGQVGSITRAYTALQVFGVPEPRLAVAAINPHGGEGGHFGDEEIKILTPAIERVRTEYGIEVAGPIPADSVFHQGLQGRYDGVLSQYHDQGHIASKTYDFDGTVSVTVGLPILRTSVDHGTAFDIAGTGKADNATMRSAYLTGVEYAPFADHIRAQYA